MVEAAAGTGKTTSMVARMLNLVAEGECQAEQMAAVTFTRKAAAELRERFQAELLSAIAKLKTSSEVNDLLRLDRLSAAAAALGQAFIGTIHSFCAQLIRERPIEFEVNPGFRELEADENQRLLDRAWQENLADMIAGGDPLLGQLKQLGLETSQLRDCFLNFVEYRDVQHWPSEPTPDFDLAACQAAVRSYIDHMRALMPSFPRERSTDKLMAQYELIVRSSTRAFEQEWRFFRMLDHFDHTIKTVQRDWHDKKVAKQEQLRFEKFREEVAKPAIVYWRQRRYQCVVQFVTRALTIYQRLKQFDGALDFTDLLLTTARGLREQPHLREYFQGRFTHLLVDEFQDTDPIQAEAVILLSSDDCTVRDWHNCRLRPGALFIVGDPKQSIYRFRRGDIVTYNRVREIFSASGGELAALTENYRSSEPLLAWNNSLFADKFPDNATDYAPAHTAMLCGRPRTVTGELSGVFQLPVEGKFRTATQNEAEHIARFIRHAIATSKTIERWSAVDNAFQLSPVRASDFMVITRVRTRIATYKAALERHGIACDVSGNNALVDNPQLLILLDVLRAADDPYNQVHFLSLLRDRLFGYSDAELYAIKRAGRSFLFTADLPAELQGELRQRFEATCQLLRECQAWLRALPPIVALERIAARLGLLAEAAAGDDGNIALGSLLKALEVLRVQSHQFDNAAELIESIEQLLEVDEAESVTAMGKDHEAVRLMNLHKAKGLESPIVFLADTAKMSEYAPTIHISRQAEQSQGAMCITIKPDTAWVAKTLAEPVGWSDLEAEEQKFIAAEENRLLYVATTRAANMLVVSTSDTQSAWSPLSTALRDAPRLCVPTDQELAQLASPAGPELDKAIRDPAQVWQTIQQPTYAIASVKKESLKGSHRPDWQTQGEFGLAWGTAVHELLEMASKSNQLDWNKQALAVATEVDIPASRVAELIETVQAVINSDIWKRSQAATRLFSELPFDLPETRDGQLTIVRGVIDLIFEEADGWVIVDYKSDGIDIEDVDSLCEYYRPQLEQYAHYWESLTGFGVKEAGVVVTRVKEYRRVL